MTAIMAGTLIGKGLLAGALSDLYLFIKSSVYGEQLEKVLQELDIKAELDIVQALLQDLANHIECRVVKVSSDQVKESVDLIHEELKKIQDEIEYHKTRYFYTWRSPSYDVNIKNLRNHRDILRKRRELLISVLSVQRNLYPSRSPPARLPPPPPPPSQKKSFLDKLLD